MVGTDTGVGKTRVAAAIARTWVQQGRRVGVIKPVSSGAERVGGVLRSADVAALAGAVATAGSPFPPPPLDRVGPLVFEAPLAPPVAAWVAGDSLGPARVIAATESALAWWTDEASAELMVIEGVGGLLCPLAQPGWTVADLAIHLDYPLIIVAHRGLGTLNQTLMTVEAARARGIRIAGIILNAARPIQDDAAEGTNAAVLASFLPPPPVAILATWEHAPDHDFAPVGPEAGYWFDLARPPRRVGRAAPTPAAVAGPPAPRSDFIGSDDDLLVVPEAENLLGSSTSITSIPADDPSSFSLGIDSSPTARLTPTRLQATADDDEVEANEGGRSSWRSVLLASYASAVTLALGWTWYQHRNERRVVMPPPVEVKQTVVDQFTDQGRLGERSRKVGAPAPIPPDRMISLGESRDIGSLRIEPKSIARQNLTLQRVNLVGKTERRPGPLKAVVLTLRLTNRSADQVFAPVDPAFVRGRSDNIFETLLELDDGRKIYPNPLAVDSEWTVIGETFGDLRPGEARDVVFATEGDAPAEAERATGTWRIKLRTGLDTTAEIGVRLPGRAKP